MALSELLVHGGSVSIRLSERLKTNAVASGKLTLADAQQRLNVTSIEKLQDFNIKLAKMIHQQDADSIARSLEL